MQGVVPSKSGVDNQESLERIVEKLQLVKRVAGERVYGQEDVIVQLITSLMSGGHVLIEGAPGLGKTLLVQTIGEVCGLALSRIQFTPDLMPSDITGTVVLVHDGSGRAYSEFQQGPIFSEMVLADEINRATPKTQSALLEAMQERTVTIAGTGHELPSPFFVLATQNPIEMEGTYVLPEAQMDRFFYKIEIRYPPGDVLDTILERTTGIEVGELKQVLTPAELIEVHELVRAVPMASHVRRCIVQFVLSTQPEHTSAPKKVKDYIRFGVTPRGAQSLVLAAKAHALLDGRYNVSFGDLRSVLHPALRHRFQLNFEGVAKGVSAEDLLTELLDSATDKASK